MFSPKGRHSSESGIKDIDSFGHLAKFVIANITADFGNSLQDVEEQNEVPGCAPLEAVGQLTEALVEHGKLPVRRHVFSDSLTKDLQAIQWPEKKELLDLLCQQPNTSKAHSLLASMRSTLSALMQNDKAFGSSDKTATGDGGHSGYENKRRPMSHNSSANEEGASRSGAFSPTQASVSGLVDSDYVIPEGRLRISLPSTRSFYSEHRDVIIEDISHSEGGVHSHLSHGVPFSSLVHPSSKDRKVQKSSGGWSSSVVDLDDWAAKKSCTAVSKPSLFTFLLLTLLHLMFLDLHQDQKLFV